MHLDERARLGGEDGVAELLDELAVPGETEVTAGVLVARVLGVLRRELREAAGILLHLGEDLVCRLLLEKKKKKSKGARDTHDATEIDHTRGTQYIST